MAMNNFRVVANSKKTLQYPVREQAQTSDGSFEGTLLRQAAAGAWHTLHGWLPGAAMGLHRTHYAAAKRRMTTFQDSKLTNIFRMRKVFP